MLKIYLLAFGIIVVAGGLQGYLQKGSGMSLIMGGILGILLVAAGLLLASNPTVALVLGGVASLAIVGRFLPAFFKAEDKVGALWPHGILSVLAIIAIVLIGLRFAGNAR